MSNAHEGVLEYGKEIGIEAGKEIGIDIGMRNKSIEIVKKMIENGCSLDFITEMTDLSLEQLKEITLNDK